MGNKNSLGIKPNKEINFAKILEIWEKFATPDENGKQLLFRENAGLFLNEFSIAMKIPYTPSDISSTITNFCGDKNFLNYDEFIKLFISQAAKNEDAILSQSIQMKIPEGAGYDFPRKRSGWRLHRISRRNSARVNSISSPVKKNLKNIEYPPHLQENLLKLFDYFEIFDNFKEIAENEKRIQWSLCRYEFFLQLLADNRSELEEKPLFPPNDVLLIWITHITKTNIYLKDCEELFGIIFYPLILYAENNNIKEEAIQRTKDVWDIMMIDLEIVDEPFEFNLNSNVPIDQPEAIEVGLTSDDVREMINFWEEFKLEHPLYREPLFLQSCVEKYHEGNDPACFMRSIMMISSAINLKEFQHKDQNILLAKRKKINLLD